MMILFATVSKTDQHDYLRLFNCNNAAGKFQVLHGIVSKLFCRVLTMVFTPSTCLSVYQNRGRVCHLPRAGCSNLDDLSL